jgi:phosphatidylglycerol lysyltransferase
MGVINVLSAVTPSMSYRLRWLEQYSPLQVSHGGHLTSALAGFALILLAASLWRRKRVAWLLTILVLAVSIVTHILKGLDYEEASLAAVLLIILLSLRSEFHARSDVPSIRQGLLTLLFALFFTIIYGVAGFYLLDKHFRVTFGLWSAFRQTIVMFTQLYDPGIEPITGFGRYFADSIYIVGMVTTSYASLMLIRPVLMRHGASPVERERASQIVLEYGHTPLARMALFDDKLYYFSAGGSMISYVVENRIALVLGDPIGPAGDAPAVISAFKSFCASNDWLTAFYETTPEYLHYYKDAGFDILSIGQEAIVELAAFTLEGSENKTLRNSYNKMVRLGYHYSVIQPPYSARLLRELQLISDDWLTNRGTSEMRFSLGWFDEAYLNTCPILLVRDREGFIESFANLVGEYQNKEVSIDLMRYLRGVESGLMDFLFVSLFQWAAVQGYKTVNMGLSALSGVGEQSDDPAIERALNYIYRNINLFYNFRGLHAFKEKFHPKWLPRYLIYPGPASLPAVSISLLNANLGGNLFSNLIRRKN